MKDFKRSERIGDLIYREVSNIILRDLKDPRIGIITLTGVSVSDDLRLATVYYSLVGDERRWTEVGKGLESSKGFIKKELGRRLKIKYIPDIRFREDRSLERGERIDRILSEIKGHDD